MGAVWAGINEQSVFTVEGAGIDPVMVRLGEDAQCFRGTIAVAGRKPIRHLVAVSAEVAKTPPGADPEGKRTVLCDDDPTFIFYRIAQRFGLPVAPEWAGWFKEELRRRDTLQPLVGVGLGCSPVLVTGTKKIFLNWIGRALRQKTHPVSGIKRAGPLERGARILQLRSDGGRAAKCAGASPMIAKLLRRAYPAQILAIMGLVRRWQQARAGAVIAECGTGKTLISLGALYTHAEGRRFTALAMVPPHLVEKRARESFQTLPGVRVFLIDGLRTPTSAKGHYGVNELKVRNGRIVREGLKASLSELRLTSRLLGSQALGRDLHEFCRVRGGPRPGQARLLLAACVVNPDSGAPRSNRSERRFATTITAISTTQGLFSERPTNYHSTGRA